MITTIVGKKTIVDSDLPEVAMLRRGRKILVIRDDEKVFCNTVQDYLECDKLEVLVYRSSAEDIHPNQHRPEG